jgi:hypothetical protein
MSSDRLRRSPGKVGRARLALLGNKLMPTVRANRPPFRFSALLVMLACAPILTAQAGDKLSRRQIKRNQASQRSHSIQRRFAWTCHCSSQRRPSLARRFRRGDLRARCCGRCPQLVSNWVDSQWLAATAAMRLVDNGKPDLDAPAQSTVRNIQTANRCRSTLAFKAATAELLLMPKSNAATAVMTNVRDWGGADALARKVASVAAIE